MIYSYKDEEFEEFLKDHLINCLEEAIRLTNKKNRLSRVLLNNYLKTSLYLAVLYHDIGKIFYQDLNKGRIKYSFPGHEILSYFFFEILFSEKIGLLTCYKEYFDIIDVSKYAILFHHHAMGLEKRLNSLREFFKDKKIKFANLKKELKENKLFDIISKKTVEILNSCNILNKNIDSRKVIEFMYNTTEKICKNLENVMRISIRQDNTLNKVSKIKEIIVITSLLTAIDYKISSEGRGSEPRSTFGKSISEFLKIYFL